MKMPEIIGVSGLCGGRIDLETTDTCNGNQDRCRLCRGSFWKMYGEVVKAVEGYS